MAKKTPTSKMISDVYPDFSDSVSDVDTEDMAKILKGADDIDDELFGLTSKNQNSQHTKMPAQTPSFSKDREKSKKISKKVDFDEFDDSDPLGDISLSDDDFFNSKKEKLSAAGDSLKPTSLGKKIESGSAIRSESSPADLKDSTKSKLIKDLFGLDNDNELVNEPSQPTAVFNEHKKSDWLGIKDSPKKVLADINFNSESNSSQKIDIPSPETTSKLNSNNKSVALKSDKQLDPASASVSKNLDSLRVDKSVDSSVLKQQPVSKSVLKENEGRELSPSKNNFILEVSKKDENDDIFTLLDDKVKTTEDKYIINSSKKSDNKVISNRKVEITDELFGKGITKSVITSSLTDSKLQVKDNDITNKNVDSVVTTDSTSLGQYMPSSGSAKRPGFGRRRGSSGTHQTMSFSPTRMLDNGTNRMSGVDLSEKSNKDDKTFIKPAQQRMELDANLTLNDTLPPWLGGKEKIDEMAVSNIFIGSNDSKAVQSNKKAQSAPLEDNQNVDTVINSNFSTKNLPAGPSSVIPEKSTVHKSTDESHLVGEVLSASSALNEQSVNIMKQTESQLLSVMQMKQQQDMIKDLCNRQKHLLVVQQQQIENLVKQQINKQLKIDEQMKVQQEKINTLMQSLIIEVQRPIQEDFNYKTVNDLITNCDFNPYESVMMNTSQDAGHFPSKAVPVVSTLAEENEMKNTITELEITLSKLKIENASLEQRLESMQVRHDEEMKNMEKFHKNEILYWEGREERLKLSQDELRKDYEARITRLQENELKLIEQHEMRVEHLQRQRMADLKQVGEFHRLAMEQVASVGKMLLEDTRLVESKRAIEASKPLDESELSTRELALLKKERELNAFKENLEKQQMNLSAERDEIEEKLQVDKRDCEEKLRQLKREQTTLKIREEEFIREQEREKELLKIQKKQIEDLREKALVEQAKAIEEKMVVTTSQARLETLAKLHGVQDVSAISSFDLVQAKAEVEGALNAAREEKQRAEDEKHKLKQQQLALEAEKWKLKEWEQEVVAKTQFVEDMIKARERKREEGFKALEEAKSLEKKFEIQNKDIQSQIKDLNIREEKLMKERLELAKERAILDKRRAHLETVLPPLSPSESLSLGIPISKNFIDPKKLIMKLKAEKEFDLSAIKT